MTTTHHTPGPWHTGIRTAHNRRDIYGIRGEPIALADEVFTSLAVAQANAQLIAAAPVMLEALSVALATIERLDARAKARSAQGTIDVIRAAITQATGENAP